MRDQQLADIRAACIRVNPEIVELKFGCQLRERGSIHIDKYIDTAEDKETGADVYYTWFYPDGLISDWEIIGHPIRLADVLLAIQETDTPMGVNTSIMRSLKRDPNEIYFGYRMGDGEHRGSAWNLRADDLTQQSDATVTFLAQLFA